MEVIQVDYEAFRDGIDGYSMQATLVMKQYNTLMMLNTLALGAHLAIACNTLYMLYQRRKMTPRIPRALFVGSLLLLGVINFALFSTAIGTVVQNTNDFLIYGVLECLQLFSPHTDSTRQDTSQIVSLCQSRYSYFSAGPESLGEGIAALLISILAQSYLVYRCFIIWSRRRFIIWFYSPILLVVIGLGIGNIYFEGWSSVDSDKPGVVLLELLPWLSWGLALALNISVTALIVGRLLWMRSKIRSALGEEYGRTYTGIAAILYESSLLYTLVVLIGYLALPGPGGTQNMFSPVLTQTECIASELIILRLAQGLAFTDETATTIAQSREETG